MFIARLFITLFHALLSSLQQASRLFLTVFLHIPIPLLHHHHHHHHHHLPLHILVLVGFLGHGRFLSKHIHGLLGISASY